MKRTGNDGSKSAGKPGRDASAGRPRADRPHVLFFLACTATWIWATSIFRLTELGQARLAAGQALPLLFTGLTFLAIICTCNVKPAALERLKAARKKPSTYVALACAGMAGELVGHIAVAGMAPAALLALNCAGTVLSAAAFASETLLLWDCFRSISFRDSPRFVLMSFVAACAVLLALVPLKGVPLQVAFPPLACVLVWCAQDSISGASPASSDEYVFRITNKSSILHLVLGFSFGLFVVMYAGNLFESTQLGLIGLAAVAGIALSAITRKTLVENPNTAAFEIGVPIVAASWLAWAVGLPREAALVLQLFGLLYVLFADQVLIIVMLGEYAIPPHAVIYIFGDLIIGMAAGLLAALLPAGTLAVMPSVMIAALLLSSTWLARDRKLRFGWIVVSIDPMDTSRDFFRYACRILGQERSLTAREQEVLQHLAMGQNRSSISRDLVISEETVKSHTKNIYRKLDVHNRQDLIDLVGEKAKKLMSR